MGGLTCIVSSQIGCPLSAVKSPFLVLLLEGRIENPGLLPARPDKHEGKLVPVDNQKQGILSSLRNNDGKKHTKYKKDNSWSAVMQ